MVAPKLIKPIFGRKNNVRRTSIPFSVKEDVSSGRSLQSDEEICPVDEQVGHNGDHERRASYYNYDKRLSQQIKDGMGTGLPEDVYSMLLVSKTSSTAFWFAVSCICFQYTIFWLIIYNTLDHESNDNKLKIPPRVSKTVSAAQAFGIYLAVCTSDDLLEAFGLIGAGYHSELTSQLPAATRTKWYISCFAKFMEGAASLFVIFMLVIQSSDCVSLFLNFAALSFVWAIDDVFFDLASNGFFTEGITQCAADVSAVSLPTPSKKSRYLRNTFYHVIIAVLFGLWADFLYLQYKGSFLCTSLLVQFDDSFEPLTSRYSGVFNRLSYEVGYRTVYEHELSPGQLEIAQYTKKDDAYIAYCMDSSTWTLSVAKSGNIDPCRESTKLAHSEATSAFEITSQAGSNWFIKRKGKARYVPYEFMIVECLDCDNELNPLRSSCSEAGECVDGKCKCNSGEYGLSCEFQTPCENIRTVKKDRFIDYCKGGGYSEQYNKQFSLLRLDNDAKDLVIIQNKPVYYQELSKSIREDCKLDPIPEKDPDGPTQDESQQPDEIGLIVYNGFRWVMIDASDLEDSTMSSDFNKNKFSIATYMNEYFHPVFSNYTSKYYSDPIKQSTNTEKIMPIYVGWNNADSDDYLDYPKQGSKTAYSPFFGMLECVEEEKTN